MEITNERSEHESSKNHEVTNGVRNCVYLNYLFILLVIIISIGLGFSISTIHTKAKYIGAMAVANAHEEAARIMVHSINEHIVSDKTITAVLINKLQLLHESDLETITFLRASLKDSIINQMNYAKLVGTGCKAFKDLPFNNRIDTLEELIKGNKALITRNAKLLEDKKK